MQSVHAARSLRAPLPSDARPVLYTHTCCPYAQRALMALLHKVRRGVVVGGGGRAAQRVTAPCFNLRGSHELACPPAQHQQQ